MSTTNIELRPIHWDILKLIRTLCYEGLRETRCALVDPNDRRLPLWEPNPDNTPFVLPNGVPEPLVSSCLVAVPFDESEQRWGKDGHGPEPVLQYLIDRGLLDVSYGNRPICAAFRNYFNDSEILSTIRFEENENGQFYSWETSSHIHVLHEQNGPLVTGIPYRVFKLTERANELLDAEKTAAEPATPAVGKRMGGPEGDPEPVDRRKLSPSRVKAAAVYEWAIEVIPGADKMPMRDLLPSIWEKLDAAISAAPPGAGEVERLQELRDSLPGNSATFAKYLRDAGIRRYPTAGERVQRTSHFKRKNQLR